MFGYRLKNGRYVIVPEEAEIVRRIYRDYLSGYGYQGIVNRLNEDGIPSVVCVQWSRTTVEKILANYNYTGNLILQKTFSENHITKKKVMNRGELPKYHAEDTHEAIIDMVTYNAVQEEKAKRAKRFVKKVLPKKIYPFTSIVTCEECGKNYRRKVSARGHVWVCTTYDRKGKSACPSKQIPEEVLESITSEVLGYKEITTESVQKEIKNILVCKGNILIFRLSDGTEVTRKWKDRSRSESWTDEMKEIARQKTLERRNHNA